MGLLINNEQKFMKLTPQLRALLKETAAQTLKSETRRKLPGITTLEISLLLCDDEHIHALNNEFRGMDKATDVLSFPAFEADEQIFSHSAIGDIVISTETAARQAEEYGHSFEREMCFLLAHGMLHLLGYDHELGEEEEKMQFARQDEVMALVGLSR